MELSVSRHPIPYHLPVDSDGFKNIVTDGSIATKQLLVFLSHDVYDFIRNQSREYSPQEIGGVLLGQYCIDNDTRFLIVPTAVACDLGSATPVSIQFLLNSGSEWKRFTRPSSPVYCESARTTPIQATAYTPREPTVRPYSTHSPNPITSA